VVQCRATRSRPESRLAGMTAGPTSALVQVEETFGVGEALLVVVH
jgi:hypothetical protein